DARLHQQARAHEVVLRGRPRRGAPGVSRVEWGPLRGVRPPRATAEPRASAADRSQTGIFGTRRRPVRRAHAANRRPGRSRRRELVESPRGPAVTWHGRARLTKPGASAPGPVLLPPTHSRGNRL